MREAVYVFLNEVGVHRDGGGGAGAGRGDDLGTRIHDIAGGLRRFMSVRVLGSLHFGVDITGRGEGNRVSSIVDERLALALEAAGLGTWTWDMASAATTWDVRLEELHGLGPGEFGGTFEDWLAALHPDAPPSEEVRLEAFKAFSAWKSDRDAAKRR